MVLPDRPCYTFLKRGTLSVNSLNQIYSFYASTAATAVARGQIIHLSLHPILLNEQMSNLVKGQSHCVFFFFFMPNDDIVYPKG